MLTILQVEVWGRHRAKVLTDVVYYMKLGMSRGLCYTIIDSLFCQVAHFDNVVSEKRKQL